ncbi:MAG TPA: cytochrome C oxidase subunit IV family protein [Caldimonas sp.]|nr:cytochrome C oxidase subunit IV family protein [Caldimonas sp.]
MNRTDGDDRTDFRGEVRDLVATWVALIALMLASLGSAYLKLGVGNALAGVAIATIKTALVVWIFMQLRRASATTRTAAAVGLATLLLLMTLSFVDYSTRSRAPAPWQSPQQIAPALGVATPP